MNYIDPSLIHPDRPTTSTRTKRIQDMSTDELKERANKEAVTYYRQQYQADPHNPQSKYEYEQACFRAGQSPDVEHERLRNLPLEKLKSEWESKGQAAEDEGLDQWRSDNAEKWIVSQPRYDVTPENAAKMVKEIERQGLRGTVMDMQNAFDALVQRGEITPKHVAPDPVPLFTRDEFSELSAAEMKAYIQRAGREGIL